jgi:hypothetical protein
LPFGFAQGALFALAEQNRILHSVREYYNNDSGKIPLLKPFNYTSGIKILN